MTNSFQKLPIFTPRRRKLSFGEVELVSLFALLSDPSLLVDVKRNQIIHANPAFLQLSSFSLSEIVGHTPLEVLPDMPETFTLTVETVSSMLVQRGSAMVPVNVQISPLNNGGTLSVLTCRPTDSVQEKMIRQMTRAMDGLRKLDHLYRTNQTTADGCHLLDRGCEVIREVFEADVVGVYQMQETTAVIQKIAASGEISLLVDEIPGEDYMRLSRSSLWRAGRRLQTGLHRAARVKKLSYLISSPFESQSILVIADRAQDSWEGMENLAAMLAEQLGLLMRYSALVDKLDGEVGRLEKDLHIWRQAVESSAEGVLLLSENMTIRAMNQAAEWMLGYASWEVHGQPVENVLIGPERLAPALQAALEGIPTHNMGVVPMHRRSGQSFSAHVQVIPVLLEETTQALLVFFSDISDNEEIAQRTQQLEQRAVLGEVTAVFAHEVRNPINNIFTGLQLLSVKLPEEDPNQENINRLMNDCQRLAHLMESVLNFSRQVEKKFEEVDLDLLLRRLLDRWRPRLLKVNVQSYLKTEAETPSVKGDPRSLEQVFTNLVSNAVEAMSAQGGGTLAIHLAPHNLLPGHPEVEVTVSDTGPGIPEDILARLFEPFVTSKAQGTGLGMAITKRIVTAHHGSISVNTFPGATIFRVLLSAYQGDTT